MASFGHANCHSEKYSVKRASESVVCNFDAKVVCSAFKKAGDLAVTVHATITCDATQNKATLRYVWDLEDVALNPDWQFNAKCSVGILGRFPLVGGLLTSPVPTQTIEVHPKYDIADIMAYLNEHEPRFRFKVAPLGANLLKEVLVIKPTKVKNRNQSNEEFGLMVYQSGDEMYNYEISDLTKPSSGHHEINERRLAEITRSHETLFNHFFETAGGNRLIFINLDGRNLGEMLEATARSDFESGILDYVAGGRPFQYHFLPLIDYKNTNDMEMGRNLVAMSKTWGSGDFVVMHCSAGHGRTGFALTVIEGAVSPDTAEAAARAKECWGKMSPQAKDFFKRVKFPISGLQISDAECIHDMYDMMISRKEAAFHSVMAWIDQLDGSSAAAARAKECWGKMSRRAKDFFEKIDVRFPDDVKCIHDMYNLMLRHKEAAVRIYQTSGTDGNQENSELNDYYRPNHSVMALVDELGGAPAAHVVL